ncbi:unnamed protein product [Phaeothamnion confervicola]
MLSPNQCRRQTSLALMLKSAGEVSSAAGMDQAAAVAAALPGTENAWALFSRMFKRLLPAEFLLDIFFSALGDICVAVDVADEAVAGSIAVDEEIDNDADAESAAAAAAAASEERYGPSISQSFGRDGSPPRTASLSPSRSELSLIAARADTAATPLRRATARRTAAEELADAFPDADEAMVAAVLARCCGNVSAAAALLLDGVEIGSVPPAWGRRPRRGKRLDVFACAGDQEGSSGGTSSSAVRSSWAQAATTGGELMPTLAGAAGSRVSPAFVAAPAAAAALPSTDSFPPLPLARKLTPALARLTATPQRIAAAGGTLLPWDEQLVELRHRYRGQAPPDLVDEVLDLCSYSIDDARAILDAMLNATYFEAAQATAADDVPVEAPPPRYTTATGTDRKRLADNSDMWGGRERRNDGGSDGGSGGNDDGGSSESGGSSSGLMSGASIQNLRLDADREFKLMRESHVKAAAEFRRGRKVGGPAAASLTLASAAACKRRMLAANAAAAVACFRLYNPHVRLALDAAAKDGELVVAAVAAPTAADFAQSNLSGIDGSSCGGSSCGDGGGGSDAVASAAAALDWRCVAVDFHGLRVDEARQALDSLLSLLTGSACLSKGTRTNLSRVRHINVICGRGKHSAGGRAKLLPAVEQYCQAQEYRFVALCAGTLRITLPTCRGVMGGDLKRPSAPQYRYRSR